MVDTMGRAITEVRQKKKCRFDFYARNRINLPGKMWRFGSTESQQ